MRNFFGFFPNRTDSGSELIEKILTNEQADLTRFWLKLLLAFNQNDDARIKNFAIQQQYMYDT
jgi:hypothetical protein